MHGGLPVSFRSALRTAVVRPGGDNAGDERGRCRCSVHVFLAFSAADRRTKANDYKWVKRENGELLGGPRKDARRYA
jgi:hypothetical protein